MKQVTFFWPCTKQLLKVWLLLEQTMPHNLSKPSANDFTETLYILRFISYVSYVNHPVTSFPFFYLSHATILVCIKPGNPGATAACHTCFHHSAPTCLSIK